VDLPNCVIPIHRESDRPGFLESWGSAVLLRALEHHFLASAAHVLADEKLWLPGKPQFLPLDEAGRIIMTAPDLAAAQKDKVDVAFVILNQTYVAALATLGCEFLSVAQTTMSLNLPPAKEFIFSGYPWRKSKNHRHGEIENTRMDAREEALMDDEIAALGLDPRVNVAMRYDREKLSHGDTPVTGPLPHGMSGGAIWQRSPDGAPILAGIATTFDGPRRLMLGTRIRPLLFRVRDTIRGQLGLPPL
jgi:hypothetical protein